jgi:ABC-type amino acid transport system permease subunit
LLLLTLIALTFRLILLAQVLAQNIQTLQQFQRVTVKVFRGQPLGMQLPWLVLTHLTFRLTRGLRVLEQNTQTQARFLPQAETPLRLAQYKLRQKKEENGKRNH